MFAVATARLTAHIACYRNIISGRRRALANRPSTWLDEDACISCAPMPREPRPSRTARLYAEWSKSAFHDADRAVFKKAFHSVWYLCRSPCTVYAKAMTHEKFKVELHTHPL